jgi:hypothetical protein
MHFAGIVMIYMLMESVFGGKETALATTIVVTARG